MKNLNNKQKISKDGVTEIVDLAEPTYIPDYESENFLVKRIIVVNSEYEKRMDLISLAVYGSDEYVDILMKCNEISDPFDLKEGEVLVIPDLNGARKFYRNPAKTSKEVKENYIDSTKKSKVDTNRLEKLAKISARVKNGSTVNVKPNELKPGESNINTDDKTNTIRV